MDSTRYYVHYISKVYFVCKGWSMRRVIASTHKHMIIRPSKLIAMAYINGHDGMSILDIRPKGLDVSLVDDIQEKLRPGKGKEKRLPTLLPYDERGLEIFEEITCLEEYYLTNAEIEALTTHAAEMASIGRLDCIIVELRRDSIWKSPDGLAVLLMIC